MPNLIKFGAQGLASNMVKCTPLVLLYIYIFTGDFSESSTEKILNNFKRLMATVGNLGS